MTLFTGLTPPPAADGCLHTPLIEIAPVADATALRQAMQQVGGYDYLLFTSRHAVAAALPLAPPMPAALRVVSIGPATTAALRRHGVGDVVQVERDDSYGVISWFAGQCRGRVLLPRSSLALPLIPDGLRRQGYQVDTVTAYCNRMPATARRVDLTAVDRIVFTSPSTIDNFLRLYGALPLDKMLVARGAVTEQHLQNIIKQQTL